MITLFKFTEFKQSDSELQKNTVISQAEQSDISQSDMTV